MLVCYEDIAEWPFGVHAIEKSSTFFQAWAKAYSPHDLWSVGIFNKNEFNTAKMAQLFKFA